MSEENVEVVRRGYEHWIATGELSSDLVHPEVVWDMSTFRGWPEQQTYSGVEGANQFLADWGETWEDWEVDVEQYLDAGEDVVTIVRQRGRSKATGVAVEMHFGQGLDRARRAADEVEDVREPRRGAGSRRATRVAGRVRLSQQLVEAVVEAGGEAVEAVEVGGVGA
jgi:ketosteroid isomerase-like protein